MTAIYLTEPGSILKVDRHQFQVFHYSELVFHIPISQVSQIVVFGRCEIARKANFVITSRAIPLLLLSEQGQYLSRLELENFHALKYVSCQIKQAQNQQFILPLAENLVWAKLHNCRILLQQFSTSHLRFCARSLHLALNALNFLIDQLPAAGSVDALRGYALTGTNFYYQALGEVLSFSLTTQPNSHISAKTLTTLFNAGYLLLNQTLYNLILAAGLDSQYGCLSAGTLHNFALAWDLMAEWTAPLVDQMVVDAILSQTLIASDLNGQGVTAGIWQKFVQQWEQKLRTSIHHPRAGVLSCRQALEWQVQEYLAYLLEDTDCYQPILLSQKAKGNSQKKEKIGSTRKFKIQS
jgi:CRISPR-associated protein Cas1